MRPTKLKQSALRYPLSHWLTSETNIRVCRVLAIAEHPVSSAEIASLASLHPSGVGKVCGELEDAGLLESVGQGRRRPYRLLERSGLSDALRQLFRAEGERWRQFTDAVKQAMSHASVISGWMQGPVARGVDLPGETANIRAIVSAPDAELVRRHLAHSIPAVERQFDVAIEWRVLTTADLLAGHSADREALQHVMLLAGYPPTLVLAQATSNPTTSPRNARTTHADLDDARLRYARAIADRLKSDPSIRDRARQQAEQALRLKGGNRAYDVVNEWHDILVAYSIPNLRRLLIGTDDRAVRLRQSMPFTDVLTEAERADLARSVEAT